MLIVVAVASFFWTVGAFTLKNGLSYDVSEAIFLAWLLANLLAKALMLFESETSYPGRMRGSVGWSIVSLVLLIVVFVTPGPDKATAQLLMSRLNEGGTFVILMIWGLCLTPVVDIVNLWSGWRGRKTLNVSETT
jgi:hypothetical protein